MKVEFEVKPEYIRAVILALTYLVLGWVLHGLWLHTQVAGMIDTNKRLVEVVARHQLANQVCTQVSEQRLLWLAARHEGESSYPATAARGREE